MKLSPIIIWIVFFVVFAIIKNIAQKADQSKRNSNATSQNDGADPLQDFFNQLGNVKTTKRVSNPEHKVNSVEEFFKVKPRVKNQPMQRKSSPKPKQPKYAKVKEAAKVANQSAQVFASAVRRDPFEISEEEPCCDAPDVISVFSEEEHAFKNKIVGEEGSVDNFGDDVCNKHKYELTDRHQLKKAVVWSEILKQPKALQ